MPVFVIHTGPTYSGKTLALLSEVDRLTRNNTNFVVFKHQESGQHAQLISHPNLVFTCNAIKAVPVTHGKQVIDHLLTQENISTTVLIDDAFAISGISQVVIDLFKSGINITVSTLDISAAGKPFTEFSKMAPWATKINKLTATCSVCGEEAQYTYATIDPVTYEPRCWNHHPMFMKVEE